MKRKTTKEFIEQAKKVHKNKYRYTKTNYINDNTKVIITCLKHGDFQQRPNHHLKGHGCRFCHYVKITKIKRSTKQEFIKTAEKVHGNKYGYEEVIYKTNKKNVKIKCFKHGIFEQTPNNHIAGNGCPICSHKMPTTEEFIERAKKVHGNKYDYSLLKYKNNKSKVKIICQYHGVFKQSPTNHVNGSGCPWCVKTISKKETHWLDSLNIPMDARQFPININKKRFIVDAYMPKTNTIYEFLGDYWHGNPNCFEINELNEQANKTFGQLYKEAMKRIKYFEKNGFNVIYIWESDFS